MSAKSGDKKSLLEKWSTPKEPNLSLSGLLTTTSSLLSNKSLLKDDTSKLKSQPSASLLTSLSSSSSTLSSFSLLKPTSTSALSSAKLFNPLLSSSKSGFAKLSSSDKPTLSTSFTKLSLQKESASLGNLGLTQLKVTSSQKSGAKKRKHGNLNVTVKKQIVENAKKGPSAQIIKLHTVKAPEYSFRSDIDEEMAERFPQQEKQLQIFKTVGKSLTDINAIKRGFINCVSGSLIAQPNLKDKSDPTRYQLLQHMDLIEQYDPEFILKVALYSRKELNIRTTSNFILAVAAKATSSRLYLKKYFNISINLPSDWIEVAEIFQTLEDRNLKLGSLPAALRKAMISKFLEFDEYQLAKYNKEKSGKKKKSKGSKSTEVTTQVAGRKGAVEMAAQASLKLQRKLGKSRRVFDSDSSDSDDDDNNDNEKPPLQQLRSISYDEKDNEEDLKKEKFTIKQLIRKLHITEPVQYVMSIIGKRYPSTSEEFYKKRLPGTFDETKAGKRMRLAVPETWETQVSLKGNKAKTWEDLIDHKKLPFMAMLRNLRNLVKAGVSAKHHNLILRRLCDQRSVINSKQFPFRFFSAYAALNELEKMYDENQKEIIQTAEARESSLGFRGGGVQKNRRVTVSVSSRGARGGRGRGRGGRRGASEQANQWWLKKKMKKEANEGVKEVSFDKNLIQRYRKALDTAVKIATVHNVHPIKGRTILLCDIGSNMDRPCSSARGLGKPRTIKEISVLMGLMCKYACEECQFIVFNETGFQEVEVKPGTILDNMDSVLNAQIPNLKKDMVNGVPYDVLLEALRDRIEVDNLLVFGEDFFPSLPKGIIVNDFLRNYRHVVNPNLLFVSVTFSSPKPGVALTVKARHPNDVYVSGYSDALLRFIAERGGEGQVNHVDKIDTAYQLDTKAKITTTKAKCQAILTPDQLNNKVEPMTLMPSWRTIRVFISSTFRDMHGERDLLTRFVFPELRSLARRKFINVYEVDLRWGVTEEQSKDNRAVEVCLQEVARCHLFVGLLGERYGWTPNLEQCPKNPELDWIKAYPAGASVTELEMHLGALSKAEQNQNTAFFFIRDNDFEKNIPEAFLGDFKAESDVHKSKVTNLKQRIRNSGLEVFDGYPCHWGGCVSGKPIVAGLEEFGARLLHSLSNTVEKLYPEEERQVSEEEQSTTEQWAFVESLSLDFVGCKTLVDKISGSILNRNSGFVGLVGKMGSGKTSLLANTILQYTSSKQVGGTLSVFFNFAGSAPGSSNLPTTVRRLAQQINSCFCLGRTLPEEFISLSATLQELIEEAATLCPTKLVLFLDGLDIMDNAQQPHSLEWLPSPPPENVVFVITALESGLTHKSLKRVNAQEILVPGLDMWDKAELVRHTLAKHSKSLNESGFGNQMKLLMLKKEASNPLYLRLACEELRVFGVFEKINDKLKQLPHTTVQMMQEILARLEEDHGVEIVTLALCFLISVRNGLYPHELSTLIGLASTFGTTKFELADIDKLDHNKMQTISQLAFSFLTRSIVCFLNPSKSWSPLLAISNIEVRNAIRQRYLKSSDNALECSLHKLLAGYFKGQADPLKNSSWQSNNTRAFMELPYHLASSMRLKELEGILCDHGFIHAKCMKGMASELLEDYVPHGRPTFRRVMNNCMPTTSKIQEKNLTNFSNLPRVLEYKSFVSRNIEILSKYPTLEWQQALNEPSKSGPYNDAVSKLTCVSDIIPYMEWSNKPEEVSECHLTLSNFKVPVTSICISSNSSMFATGSQDMVVRLYSMSTGKEICSFTGHSDMITDVCFIGASMLCSASADTTLSIWSVVNEHRIETVKGHNRRVNSCASDSHGKLMASGGWDCTVIVWKTSSPFARQCTLDVGSPVNSVAFHPTLEQVVVGSWDSLIRIYNYLYETRIAVLRGHSTSVRDLSFSFDGLHLASAALDGDIKIWAANKGSQVGNIRGHAGPINKLIFSRTGRELITAGEDRQIKVWSGELGIPLHCIHNEKLGAATSVCISPNGETLAIGFHLGYVLVHDVNTGAKLCKARMGEFAIRAITFTTDGNYILAGSDDASVQVLQSSQCSKVCVLVGQEGPVMCLATSKNYIAVGGEDYTCCLYENINHLKSSKQAKPSVKIRGHDAPVTGCCFNSDETMLATASRDASVKIYKVKDAFITSSPQPHQTILNCHADWINSCQWSNLGPFLVTASNDFNLKVFDVKSGTEKLTISGHSSAVNTVAFKYGCIVSGSSDGSLQVFSHKGTPITALNGHTLRVNACDMFVKCKSKIEDEAETSDNWAEVMDKDEQPTRPSRKAGLNIQDVIVASAGDDGDVWVWRPLQANNLTTLSGHADRILSVGVDQNQRLVSCSLDRTVRLWEPKLSILPANGDEKQTVGVTSDKHDAPVTFVAVSSDSKFVISGSRDGIVKVWSQQEDSKYVVRSDFQAHEKSVNCGSFTKKNSKAFVTGGDDNAIHAWEIFDNKNSFYTRKQFSMQLKMPVASVLTSSSKYIYASTWDGCIFACTSSQSMKPLYHVDKSNWNGAPDAANWACSMALNDSDFNKVVLGTTKSSFIRFSFHDCADWKHGALPKEIVINPPPEDQSMEESEAQEYEPSPNWISALTSRGDFVLAGDSRGQLTLHNSLTEFKETRKIHKDEITALDHVDDTLFTASHDGTIKVWSFSFEESLKMDQIGQFFCSSPVNSLTVTQGTGNTKTRQNVFLLAGDLLGNIYQLKWCAKI